MRFPLSCPFRSAMAHIRSEETNTYSIVNSIVVAEVAELVWTEPIFRQGVGFMQSHGLVDQLT